MAEVFALMKADQDAARGEGYWRTYVERILERWSHWPGYGYADLAKITVPPPDPGRRSRPLLLCGGGCGGIQKPRPWPARRDTKHRARDQHRQDRGTSQLPHQLDLATPGEEQHSEGRPSLPALATDGSTGGRGRSAVHEPDPEMLNIAQRPAEAEAELIIGR